MSPIYVFDVGPIAVAHADTPVSDRALDYLKQAICGEITGIVPTSALMGAHHVLKTYYNVRYEVATDLLTNLQRAKEIRWYEDLENMTVTESLKLSGSENINAWDGYYARVARECNADKLLTIDDDFEPVDDINSEVILDEEDFKILNKFRKNIDGPRGYADMDASGVN